MAQPPVRCFAYFQISPIVQASAKESMTGEEFSRLNASSYVHQHIKGVQLIEEKVYRGYVSRLQQELSDWTRTTRSQEGIICITCHGQQGTGRFRDYTGDNEEIRYWTAEALWNGFPYALGSGANRFDGLRKLLSNAAQLRSIIVVLAPCYGAYFADNLRACVTERACSGNVDVEVVGLSYGKTYRLAEPNLELSKLKPATYSYELMDWFRKGCLTPRTGQQPKQDIYAGPGGDAIEEEPDMELAPVLEQ